ncbi:MAG: hypothetical protein RL643_26, partial [Actinomycetota bacterium]
MRSAHGVMRGADDVLQHAERKHRKARES